MAHKRIRETTSWISKSKYEIEHEEELLACRLIVLKIVRYMKDHHLSQKDLAEKLNVSPQYINKFLHGQDLDMKVSTIVRYGRILGIKLLEVPFEDDQRETRLNYGTKQIATPLRQSVPSSYETFSSIMTLNLGMRQVTSAVKNIF